MTKAVIGVDPAGIYKPAAHLLHRMQLPGLSLHGVSVVEPIVPDMSLSGFAIDHPAAVLMEEREKAAEAALDQAKKIFGSIPYQSTVTFGGTAKSLLHHAEEIEADLVVVGSERKGAFGSLFLGSTTKGLTIEAHQCLLIGKREAHEAGGLHAVIATDLSKYMDKCLERLAAMAPQGISKITLLHTFEVHSDARHFLSADDPDLGHLSPERQQEELTRLCANEAKRLQGLGAEVDIRVLEAHPHPAINETMEETGADLLILGAQGKNFMERLVLGSTAMHYVLSEDFNLLILRL